MRRIAWVVLVMFLPVMVAAAPTPGPEDFRADARSIERVLNENYAYLDRFPDGVAPLSPELRAEAEAVTDRRSLLRYAERALLALADHHAHTGSNLSDSWALVPTYGDLWIEKRGDDYVIEAVRNASPAARAGVRAGQTLAMVDGVPIEAAVKAFWADLGMSAGGERDGFAARVLAAGKRDPLRRLTVRAGRSRSLEIASLYAVPRSERPPLSVVRDGRGLRISFHADQSPASASAPRAPRLGRPSRLSKSGALC